jgi:deazaflavin-dependent oxidoreductase (nitroreductase family)
MRRLSKTRWLRFVISRALTPLDMKLRGSRFAPSTFGLDMPLCFLTTTGRRSGEPRTVPLLFIETDGGAPAVAATNFGRPSHPAWALNLEATPAAIFELEGESRTVTARRATGDEVVEIWPRFDGIWPAYEEYREISHRDIKVFILE